MNVGRTIKLLRQAAGMDQKTFAERIGLSNSAVSLYETGQREPPLSVLTEIGRVLRVPTSVFLVTDEDDPDATDLQRAENERIRALFACTLQNLMFNQPREETDNG
jgi:transcriptional regulator with XRE-family HTH domain